MTAILPYFHVRDGVYQYERRVPLGVQRDHSFYQARFGGRPLFRRSLRTKCKAKAALAWQAAHETFEALLARPVTSTAEERTYAPLRAVTDHDLVAIAARYTALTVEPFESLHRRANVDEVAAAELARLESDLEIDGEAIKIAFRSRDANPTSCVMQPASEAAFVIAEHGFFAPEGSEFRGAIIGAIRNGLEQGYRRVSALSQGEALAMLGTAVAPVQPVNTMTLANAVNRYLTDRQPPVKAVSEMRLALSQFEQVVGRKSLAALTRDDARQFMAWLSEKKVGGRTKGSIVRHLSEQSIGKRVRMLSASINHARDRGLFSGDNVLSGCKVAAYAKSGDKAAMPVKRRLQVSELNAIFTHPWFVGCKSPSERYSPGTHRLKGAEFWVPIVALYTGCRAGELGGMKVSDVRLNDLHPHLVVRDNEYRRTKSRRARRVPILDALVAIGFPAYVESIRAGGHERLFPDWTARVRKGGGENDYPAWSNSTVIRAFNRTVIPVALGERLSPEARREVTFHSLRGAFKAMLAAGNNVTPVIVNAVVGHKNDDLDERYIGEATIEETYPVVHAADFAGLVLPASPTLP